MPWNVDGAVHSGGIGVDLDALEIRKVSDVIDRGDVNACCGVCAAQQVGGEGV